MVYNICVLWLLNKFNVLYITFVHSYTSKHIFLHPKHEADPKQPLVETEEQQYQRILKEHSDLIKTENQKQKTKSQNKSKTKNKLF